MEKFGQILSLIIAAGFLTWFLLKGTSFKEDTIKESSDTTKATVTKITTTENTFSAEQVGNIKRVLIDSLKQVYGDIINSLTSPLVQTNRKNGNSMTAQPNDNAMNDSAANDHKNYAFVSEVKKDFVAKDSSGSVTDSMRVVSTFISPKPLPSSCIHLVKMQHKSFNKEKETTTTINNTRFIERKKSFFERFKVVPNISAGCGLINKNFDIYAGVGIAYEF